MPKNCRRGNAAAKSQNKYILALRSRENRQMTQQILRREIGARGGIRFPIDAKQALLPIVTILDCDGRVRRVFIIKNLYVALPARNVFMRETRIAKAEQTGADH